MPTPLSDALDATRFGGKTAALARARQAGLPVPDGTALDCDEVEAVVAGDPSLLDWLATQDGRALAVRSSALGEDGAAASFAGAHRTVLSPDDLGAAIVAVHASAQSPAALVYRARRGLVGPPRMAVLLQMLVRAEASAIVFTRDPRGPRSGEMLVEATSGGGQALSDGTVDPERLRLGRAGERGEHTLGASPSVLTDARCRAIVAIVKQLDHLIASDRGLDLELAFVGDEPLLLQARPIAG